MPQLAKSTRQERAARLRTAGEQAMARFLERQVGRTAQILVERDGRGRSETFAPFRIETDGHAPMPGAIVTAQAERIQRGVVIGRLMG